MVKYRADTTFDALADPTRRAMVDMLAKSPRRVTDLARPFAMSLPAVSKHIRVLCEAGIVRKRREGRIQWCSLEPAPLEHAAAWIQRNTTTWERRLDRLDEKMRTS